MNPEWYPTTDRPIRSGAIAPLAASCIGIVSLLLPGPFRTAICPLALLLVVSQVRGYTTGRPEEDYVLATSVAFSSLKFIDFVLLRDPERDLYRVDVDDPTKRLEDEGKVRDMTIWEKLRWSMYLWTTVRGIGWNWKVRNVDEGSRSVSRWSFVLRQLSGVVYCYLITDITSHLLLATVYGYAETMPALFLEPIWVQCGLAWLMAFRTGLQVASGYYIGAMVTVGLGLSQPQSWPPLFGRFSNAYTLRRVWGRCWHQQLRRTFDTYTELLISILRIRKGTTWSRYMKLYAAFFISATIHHIGSMNTLFADVVKYQFIFFMIQPIGITIEDIASAVGKAAGLKENMFIIRLLGFAWVFAFMSYSLRFAAAYMYGVGFVTAQHDKRYSIADYQFG